MQRGLRELLDNTTHFQSPALSARAHNQNDEFRRRELPASSIATSTNPACPPNCLPSPPQPHPRHPAPSDALYGVLPRKCVDSPYFTIQLRLEGVTTYSTVLYCTALYSITYRIDM